MLFDVILYDFLKYWLANEILDFLFFLSFLIIEIDIKFEIIKKFTNFFMKCIVI